MEAAVEQLGVSRRQVYVLLRRWREGQGMVSELFLGRSSGGRGGQRLPVEVEAVVRDAEGDQVIADNHLPRTLAEQRARQTPAARETTVTS